MFRSPLYRHGNFLRLWVAQTVSLFGTQVTALALPTVAILLLHASPFEVGTLAAMPWLAYVSVGLIAGVIVDRLPRRRIMITSDFGRALALGTVPIAFLFGIEHIVHLYLVAALVGVFNVFFEVSYQSYPPTLLEQSALLEGNSKLAIGEAAALTGGPALGGILMSAIGAPLAIMADGISYLFSALFLGTITQKEERAKNTSPMRLNTSRAEIAGGFRYAIHQPVIRALIQVSAVQNFGEYIATPMFLIFMYVNLHLSPAVVGLTVAIGSVGFLMGASLVTGTTRKLGIGPMLYVSSVLGVASFLVLPLGVFGLPVLWVGLWRLLYGLHTPSYNVTVVSIRQMIIPHHLQGRVTATSRVIGSSVGAVSPIIGGALGMIWGPVPIIICGGVIYLLGSSPILSKAVITLRQHVTTAAV